MLLDLSEVFVCPVCRPTQGLVVLVDEIRDRRVLRGHLGCPACDARYPVERGTLRFDAVTAGGGDGAATEAATGEADGAGGAPPGPAPGDAADADDAPAAAGAAELLRGVSRREAAVRLAALLGLPEAEGPFLLFPALADLADPLAGTAEDEEVLALAPADRPGASGGAARGGRPGEAGDADASGPASQDVGPAGVTRVHGAPPGDLPLFSGRLGGAALMAGPAEHVEEAARVLREGARLVVLEPDREARDAVGGTPLELVAEEARALVAVRRF